MDAKPVAQTAPIEIPRAAKTDQMARRRRPRRAAVLVRVFPDIAFLAFRGRSLRPDLDFTSFSRYLRENPLALCPSRYRAGDADSLPSAHLRLRRERRRGASTTPRRPPRAHQDLRR